MPTCHTEVEFSSADASTKDRLDELLHVAKHKNDKGILRVDLWTSRVYRRFGKALFAFRRRMCCTGFRLALTTGSGRMDRARFRSWFSRIDELTAEQCHRFLAAVRQSPDRLAGIVEADETFVLESRKGRADARGYAHPDGQQPPQPDQGLPRHCHQVSRQLSKVVPSRRPRQASIAKSMLRSRQPLRNGPHSGSCNDQSGRRAKNDP